MPRIRLEVEYLGISYHGFQSQASGIVTVQETIENALAQLCNHPVRVVAAGRTDRGVHAHRQTLHFDTHACRSKEAFLFGTNYFLPPDIRVQRVSFVPDTFNARFSALTRSYQYRILNMPVDSAILHQRILWYPKKLDHALMHEAVQYLLGEHDFSAFRAQGCQAKSPVRTVLHAEVLRNEETLLFNIEANGFLYNMVRNITGSLLAIGTQKKPVAWMQEVLISKDRTLAAMTIPPHGLYFMKATYPPEFENTP